MGLREDLGRGPIGLDTAVFIYFIEEHSRFLPVIEPIFLGLDQGAFEGVTSTLTLLETLVVPYRIANPRLAEQYEALLTRGRGLRLIELDRPLLRAAAELRARFSIKTPDALQIAAALAAGCTDFVTNDRALPSLPGLKVRQLSQYV